MFLRPFWFVAVLAGTLCVPDSGRADLLDYCPDEGKSVWCFDIARLQQTDAAKRIAGNQPLIEYLKLELNRRNPKAAEAWKVEPHSRILDEFAVKTSRVMMCDFGGFLNFALFYEGEYDAARLEKSLAASAGDGKKHKRVVGKNYVLFENKQILFFLLAGKVLIVCTTDRRETFLKHLDREVIKQSTARSVVSVRKAFGDPSVCFAFAFEDTNRELLGKHERKSDMALGTLAFREGKIDFRMVQGHDTPDQTAATKTELTETRNRMAAALEGCALAAPFRAVTVEVDGKDVVAKGETTAKALHESTGFLLDKFFRQP